MTPRRKLVMIITIFVVVSIMMIIFAIAFRLPERIAGTLDEPKQTTYVDPASGETIIETDGKTPEGLENGPTMLGFSRLLDMGLTNNQFLLATDFIGEYGRTHKLGSDAITQISLVVASTQPNINQRTGAKSITADIQINRSLNQRLVLTYKGYTEILVRIYNKSTNKLLYSSPDQQTGREID